MSRPIGTAAELERRRRLAVERVRQGESPTTVARILGVNRASLYRWRRAAARGPDGLAAKPQLGPPPRLADAQLRELEALLRQGATAHGWPNRLWTAARVAQLIRRHFGVTYHPDHVGRFLRARLHWTPQKPKRKARERDEDDIAHWRRVKFPRIAREAFARGAHLVFLDEAGFQLTPCLRRTWAPRGQTPILEAWDRRDKISAISCVTVSPRSRRLNLYFDLLPDNASVRAEDVVAYLGRLRQVLPAFTVVWDRNQIHSKSRLVQAYLAAHPEVVAEDFPGYVPELNPDEGVWGWGKYGRLANLAAPDTDHLRDWVIGELVDLKHRPHLLASFIRQTNLPLLL